MRRVLEENTVLEFDRDNLQSNLVSKVIIKDVLGIGSSCIAYKVEDENGIPYILKECMPRYAVRNLNNQVIWTPKEKDFAFKRFKDSHELQKNLLKNKDFVNINAHILTDLLKCNDTIYELIDINNTRSYDNCLDDNLLDTLKTIKAISRTMSLYHEQGYLFLDINPANIMIYPETREMVLIVDFDSVLKKEEITLENISYTQKYAAPEILRRKLSRIDERSDVYSLGVMLFERIFNRNIELSDNDLRATYDFSSSPLIRNAANPRLTALLTDILHSTICASPLVRKSAKEIAALLDEAIDVILKGEPFILSNINPSKLGFIGRETELSQIKNGFDSDKNVIVLRGVGGIGKSELARRYSEIYTHFFDTILFVRYTGDLTNDLCTIPVYPIRESILPNENLNTLKEILMRQNNSTLLILDNFDVTPEEANGIDVLLSLLGNNNKLIITTRSNLNDVLSDKRIPYEIIDVHSLENVELIELFENTSKISLTPEQIFTLDDLIEKTGGHTMYIELLAKMLRKGSISFQRIAEIGSEIGVGGFKDQGNVTYESNEKIKKNTIYQLIADLFDINQLSEVEKRVLCLTYLNGPRFSMKYLFVYSNKFDFVELEEALFRLVDIGLINKLNNDAYSLHAIIQELIKEEWDPCLANYTELHSTLSLFMTSMLEDAGVRNNTLINIKSNRERFEKSLEENPDYYFNNWTLILKYLIHSFKDKRNHHVICRIINTTNLYSIFKSSISPESELDKMIKEARRYKYSLAVLSAALYMTCHLSYYSYYYPLSYLISLFKWAPRAHVVNFVVSNLFFAILMGLCVMIICLLFPRIRPDISYYFNQKRRIKNCEAFKNRC